MTKEHMCVAIPVGGVVHEDYLIENLKVLKASPCKIVIGIDATPSLLSLGNHDKVHKICQEYADCVIEFPSESYYRPGGFWKKIYQCWKYSKSTYVRALGYDDLLTAQLIAEQHEFMLKNPKLDCSYANCLIKDENKKLLSFQNTKQKGYRKVLNIGRNPFSFISWVIKFDSIDNPEFENKLERSSMGFEYFLHKELFSLNVEHFPSTVVHSPLRREHSYTISEYAKRGINHDKTEIVKKMRQQTGYSEEQALSDWRSLKMKEEIHLVRRKHSFLYAWMAKFHDYMRGVHYVE